MNRVFRGWPAWLLVLLFPCFAWSQTQTIETIAGTGIQGYAGDGGPARAALLAPESLVIDRAGNVFIAEPVNHVVRRIDHASGVITTYAGTGQGTFNGEGQRATATNLGEPYGIAMGPDDDLYIADILPGSLVWRVDHRTSRMFIVAGGSERGFSGDGGPAKKALINLTDIGFDRDGNLLIDDSGNERIRRVDRRTQVITTIVGSGIAGAGPASGPASAAGFLYFISSAVDRRNHLFFADAALSTVRELDPRTRTFKTVAGVYPNTTGIGSDTGYNGDGQPATQALLNVPTHIGVDCAGDLTISDTFNYRVRQVDARTGIIETLAGTGASGYSGDGGLAIQAMLTSPRGIAFGPDGALYIADAYRIRKVVGLPGHREWDCRDRLRYHLGADWDGDWRR